MARKAFTVRLDTETADLLDNLCTLTNQSKSEFFQGLLDEATPALEDMRTLLLEAQKAQNPHITIGRALAMAARHTSRQQDAIAQEAEKAYRS